MIQMGVDLSGAVFCMEAFPEAGGGSTFLKKAAAVLNISRMGCYNLKD
jgi:hypothetical protein